MRCLSRLTGPRTFLIAPAILAALLGLSACDPAEDVTESEVKTSHYYRGSILDTADAEAAPAFVNWVTTGYAGTELQLPLSMTVMGSEFEELFAPEFYYSTLRGECGERPEHPGSVTHFRISKDGERLSFQGDASEQIWCARGHSASNEEDYLTVDLAAGGASSAPGGSVTVSKARVDLSSLRFASETPDNALTLTGDLAIGNAIAKVALRINAKRELTGTLEYGTARLRLNGEFTPAYFEYPAGDKQPALAAKTRLPLRPFLAATLTDALVYLAKSKKIMQ